jgi:hypothetical protein
MVRKSNMPAADTSSLARSSEAIEAMAAAIDLAALSAGPLSPCPAGLALPRATWHAILRSRRLRVFDWIADAGFRLLNLLPGSSESFLKFAEQHELHHKYSVARKLWPTILQETIDNGLEDAFGWVNAIAQAEILLVELREPVSGRSGPEADCDFVALSAGVRLVKVDPVALDLHLSIPEFSLPAHVAKAELSALHLRFPQRLPQPQEALMVPASQNQLESSLVQIESALACALRTVASQAMTVAQLRDRIGSELLTNLLQIGAFSRCRY